MEIAGTAVKIEQMVASRRSRDGGDVLRQVFARAGDGLYRFILVRVAGNRDAADDLVQQTCCEAARCTRPPANHDECEAWLRGIARNLIRRRWRRLRRRPGLIPLEDAALAGRLADDLESQPLPPDALIQKESIDQLLLAVTSLSAAEQSLIFAYYFDGRRQADIARELGVTEKSIESRLFRVRGRLRTALRHLERSGEP